MRVIKIDSGWYEASSGVKGATIPLIDGTVIPVGFVAHGETHFEAIKHCLDKIEEFLSPPSSSMFEENLLDNEEDEKIN